MPCGDFDVRIDPLLRHDSGDGEKDDHHADIRNEGRTLAEKADADEDRRKRLESAEDSRGCGADETDCRGHGGERDERGEESERDDDEPICGGGENLFVG